MPITLGCPSCGKRFRARDESAGKRVRCPYCQAAVPVPSPQEAQNAAAPTERVPPSAASAAPPNLHPPSRATVAPAPVAPAAGWVDESPAPAAPATSPRSGAFGSGPLSVGVATARPSGPVKKGKDTGVVEEKPRKTAAQLAAPKWKKARAGLWWVLLGLFFLALPGFAPFGISVYERTVESIPEGKGWIKVEGYVNDDTSAAAGSLKLTKRQEVYVLALGVPFLLGVAALTLGRMTCGAVPRSSGAKGMFSFSALFTIASVVGLVAGVAAFHLGLYVESRFILAGAVILVLLTEAWFLTGLAVCGAALKRPRAARAVGLLILVVGLVGGLVVAAVAHSWDLPKFTPKDDYSGYTEPTPVNPDEVQPVPEKKGKGKGKGGGKGAAPPKAVELPKPDPKKPEEWVIWARKEKLDEETWIYKSAGGMIAWLLLIGVYWRAVGATRWAIRDAVERVEDLD
jgi:hypothetical protein